MQLENTGPFSEKNDAYPNVVEAGFICDIVEQ